jgi:primosomal protein N' (replication factor Y)
MERRAGKFRAVLMVSAERRGALADALLKILKAIEESPLRHRVRWHIDVDPEEAG